MSYGRLYRPLSLNSHLALMKTFPIPLPEVGTSSCAPSRSARLVGSSAKDVDWPAEDALVAAEVMLPGKEPKWRVASLNTKLVFIIQRFDIRLRPVTSRPLYRL